MKEATEVLSAAARLLNAAAELLESGAVAAPPAPAAEPAPEKPPRARKPKDAPAAPPPAEAPAAAAEAPAEMGEKESLDEAYKLAANYIALDADATRKAARTQELRDHVAKEYKAQNITGLAHPQRLQLVAHLKGKLAAAARA